MTSKAIPNYAELLEKAITLMQTHPGLRDTLIDECHHWKGEVDALEVSCVLFSGLHVCAYGKPEALTS